MDSCVAAAIAYKNNDELAFLHINYGQLTECRELEAFNAIADYYRVKDRIIVNMSYLSTIGGSCLTDDSIPVPDADLESTEIPISYVPFRNANILSAAVSWAEVLEVNSIYIGAVEEDSSGYPDCRRTFYDTFEKTIDEGTRPKTKIKIITPLIELSKKEIVLKGIELNIPLHLTWSCYQNETNPCGKCDSCALRAKGFQEAGVIDPLLSFQNNLNY